jgi:hypothetical protein
VTPARLDLEVPRNGSDMRTLQLFTEDSAGVEVPLDLTGMDASATARDVFGGSTIVGASVSIIEAAQGKISLSWLGSNFDGFGDAFADSVAAWDLKLVDVDGVPVVPVRGILHITPEATA